MLDKQHEYLYMSIHEATLLSYDTVKRLQNLSKAEIEALADAVEAGKPLRKLHYWIICAIRMHMLCVYCIVFMLWTDLLVSEFCAVGGVAIIIGTLLFYADPENRTPVRDDVMRLLSTKSRSQNNRRGVAKNHAFLFYTLRSIILWSIALVLPVFIIVIPSSYDRITAEEAQWYLGGIVFLWLCALTRYVAVGFPKMNLQEAVTRHYSPQEKDDEAVSLIWKMALIADVDAIFYKMLDIISRKKSLAALLVYIATPFVTIFMAFFVMRYHIGSLEGMITGTLFFCLTSSILTVPYIAIHRYIRQDLITESIIHHHHTPH